MRLAVLAFVCLACAGPVLAETVTLPSSADLPLIAAHPASNRGLGGQHYWVSGDTLLLKFDLSSVPAGRMVKSATLQFYSGHLGPYAFDWQVTAHAMRVAWQEGIGTTDGVYGSINFPWGPASIGDATFSYRQVTATGPDPAFQDYVLATDGVPWEVPGALGTNQDCFPDPLIDEPVSSPLTAYPAGTPLPLLTLTSSGCRTLTSWINGATENHGMVVAVTGTGDWRVATREHSGTPGTAGPYAPQLAMELGVLGDIDGDDEVSVLDIVAVVTRFGLTPADSDWNDICDFDGDGEISVLDIVFVVTRFGNTL